MQKIVAAILEGKQSAMELLEQAQAASAAHAHLNPLAHADWEAARALAAQRDREARAGLGRGALHGIPLSVKDLFQVDGMPMTAGTAAPLPAVGAAEALAVQRLRAAGAVLFAKTNMNEIALGVTGENACSGDVKNPHDPARQSGGSSSGSAVSVAAGIGLGSLASDTGGSIRVPASFCGVTGFKPSFGAIPLAGSLPLSPSCDHAGPIARNVQDAHLLFCALAQRSYVQTGIRRRPRLVVPGPWLRGCLHPAVREAFEASLAALQAVAELSELEVPGWEQAFSCYTTIVRAEAAFVHAAAMRTHPGKFSPAILQSLQGGAGISAVDYLAAQRQRAQFSAALAALLTDHDAMLLPTSTVPVPWRGQEHVDIGGASLALREAVLRATMPFNLAGLPALSLPVLRAQGLPLGLQVVAGRGRDQPLLSLGAWLQEQLGAAQEV